MINKKVWFITGCSSGFGNVLAQTLLKEGEMVVATARNISALKELENYANDPLQLLILPLDLTKNDQIHAATSKAVTHFGRIDVLVNNAGYGAIGALEEISESEIRRVFETNVFGLFEMTRAVLPIMREQKSGHILNLSSVAGAAAIGGASIYAATKFAVEGQSEGLAQEVAPHGIKVTLVQPGSFRTQFANRSLSTAPYHPAYDESLGTTRKMYATIGGNQPGDPEAAVKLMIEIVRHPNPPLRIVMGKVGIARVEKKLQHYLAEIEAWREKGSLTDYPEFR